MLLKAIETFERDAMLPIYRHIRDHGRQLPGGWNMSIPGLSPTSGAASS